MDLIIRYETYGLAVYINHKEKFWTQSNEMSKPMIRLRKIPSFRIGEIIELA